CQMICNACADDTAADDQMFDLFCHTAKLFLKNGRKIPKALKFQCVAAWVQKEHRSLFADLAFETDLRFDDERDAFFPKPFGKFAPFVHRKKHAEMRDRHGVIVHAVRDVLTDEIWCKMRYDLVPEQVEIYPMFAASAFAAFE